MEVLQLHKLNEETPREGPVELELVKLLASKECQLLKTGYSSHTMVYAFCACDPDQKEPMCLDCYNNCHQEHAKDRKEMVSYIINAICTCGINCHRIGKDANQQEEQFLRKCLFMDWSEKSNTLVYYASEDGERNFCLFCANFCERIGTLKKKSTASKGNVNTQSLHSVDTGKGLPECCCTGENHTEVKNMFKKLQELRFLHDLEFEYFTPTHMLNLISHSLASFQNSFKSFTSYITKLKVDLESDSNYFIDSNIGYSASMKALETLSLLADASQETFYFNDSFDELLERKFVFHLLDKKFDYKAGKNIWVLKNLTFNLYCKLIFKRDFESVFFLNVKDIENLHPLQRLLYIRAVESHGHLNESYFNNLKVHPLDSTLNVIERLNSVKEKHEVVYEILAKCYEICLTYASLGQFFKDRIMRFCTLNDDIISGTEADKKVIPLVILRSQLRMLVPMTKALLYLVYYNNDEMIEAFLLSQKDISKVMFFHSNSDVGKIINKNCINTLNYIRHCKSEGDKEEFAGERHMSMKTVNTIMTPDNNARVQREEVEKLMRKVLISATNITSIAINYPDHYLIGFRRLMERNKETYMSYISKDTTLNSLNAHDAHDAHEKNFVDKVKGLKEGLDEVYADFFSFRISEESLIKSCVASVRSFFAIAECEDYKSPAFNSFVANANNVSNINQNQNVENPFRADDNFNLGMANNNLYFNQNFTLNPNPHLNDDENTNNGRKIQFKGKNENFETVKQNMIVENEKEILGLNSKEDKFRILINTTLYVPIIIKSLKILLKVCEYKNNTLFQIDGELLDQTLRLLYFYIELSPDNCMMLLTHDTLNTLLLLGKRQIEKFIDLLHAALSIIGRSNTQMVSNSTLIQLIKKLVLKVSADPECISSLKKVLSIVRLMTEIKFINQEYTHKKLREILVSLFEANSVLVKFKNYLVGDSTGNTGNTQTHTHKNIFNDLPLMGKQQNVISISVPITTTFNNISNNNNMIEGYNILSLYDIYIKFLKMVNYLFDGNATLNEHSFLEKVLTQADVPNILKNRHINLQLRIEVLKFFRMSSIDVIIDQSKLEEYRSLFVNQISLVEGGLFEDGYNYKFFNDLLLVNHDTLNLGLESAVIKYELKYFESIIERSECKDSAVILEYFQSGVLLPLLVFLNKFMAIIYNLKGYEYLKLYEIVVYFLRLKKFLIENRNKFEQTFNYEFKSVFKSYLEVKKSKFSMINNGFTNEEYQEVLKDIEAMCQPHFEILNYKIVYGYFEKHLEGFINKPKCKSLNKLFEKREFNYDEQKLRKMESHLKGIGLLKSIFEKKVFELIVKYENDKNKFHESAFVQNLGEHNIQFDSNYRAIILKTVFFLVFDPVLGRKYRKQNFWHLFKLLQYDTVPTQSEIFTLYQQDKRHIDLPTIVDLFLENLLSLIFSSCNPSSTVMNEDYFIAMTVVKILKYMCEEHNINFQTIFFKELKFSYTTDDDIGHVNNVNNVSKQISLFDLLLGVISKIVVLSKWDRVKFGADDNAISYFYDIFFVVIELMIEMVQGTKSENLEIIKHSHEDDPFSYFLHSVKTLLLRDKNDSPVVYKVRRNIIDFIVAFLEEKATPKKVISLISSVFNPFTVFETIVNTLKKLYLKKIQPLDSDKVKQYKTDIFDHKKCHFFITTYFSDLEFCQTPEFELSNRLYQYVKLLATQYANEDAINIIESISVYQETQLINLYTKKLGKSNDEKFETDIVLDDAYIQNYFAVVFFEKITRSVVVQKDNEEFPVLFTLNPLVPYLSSNTKNDFYQNVNRESRYTKLFSLMEYCDYFFDEIKYNSLKLSNSSVLRQLNQINYYYAESGLFLFTIVINLIMIIKLNTKEVTVNDYAATYPAIKALAIVEVVLNFLVLVAWFISKFPLYYEIEKKKYSLKYKIESLGVLEKTGVVFYNTIFLKNETNGFIWNIIFASIGCSSPEKTFLFSIQLLIIINLSITLKNIIKSVTLRYKQLLAAAMFVVIMLYVFACIAFFFLEEDFIFTVGGGHELMRVLSESPAAAEAGSTSTHAAATAGNQENQCGSLLYCFLTHLDYGLRTDGGIGEHLRKISFNANPGYYIGRFFYEIMFFIVMIVILLSIVFGIIIDTFAELREETHKVETDKMHFCYICGVRREDLEKNCLNFEKHVTKHHDIWTYADYIIGLKFVDPQETNAINSHVIEMIEQKSISWLPSWHWNSEEKSEH